ncbi:MAG: class I poly(R)-hydroxyalkanoic acid synthase [Rhodospirillaceae bacterium]|nr:class I poly(R)-hydroxyalkanoic acid synthase [Rhodospirillaceae bacterium]
MNDQQAGRPHSSDSASSDPMELGRTMGRIADQTQRLLMQFAERSRTGGNAPVDPLNVMGAFIELTHRMMADPVKMMQAHVSLWQDYMNLWQTTAQRMMGHKTEPVISPAADDRRFKHEGWQNNELFDYVKQSYLLTARWVQATVGDVEGIDEKTRRKIEFYTRQFVDAMAPSNFAFSNPEVIQATIDSNGENLVKGLENLLNDLERGKGKLAISMTDYEAFEVGRNVAITPGKVVFQNDLIQLLQYEPTTKTVHRQPLLIMPPWINKFYILDLREKNSFVRWAVAEGHTVFVISWVNPDEKLAAKTFEDYMLEGPLAALGAIEKATGEREVNVIGYCLGGTLLAATLAWMAAKKDARVKSATFFTTLTDFKEPGELEVFIDEDQIRQLEDRMAEKGYLEGSAMANTFNMLRANDLIWSFVINNYLLGKEPFPFDLLYWNSDSTRMPAAMHSFYLRKMYQENKLIEPGGIKLSGVPIDLRKVAVPVFMLSTREDHIAPWKATYAATQLFKGPTKFVLAASGHIAGVINHPDANKYNYWTGKTLPADSDTWLETAEQHPGSWWPEWSKWVAKHGGGQIPARKPGDGKLKPIEDAPGSYAKVKAH